MCTIHKSLFRSHDILAVLLISLALMASCSAPVERPTGPAGDYQDAKDMFKRNRFDRALDFTDGLSTANPPTKVTDKARVLRVVIFTGQLKSAMDLVDSYSKGADQTKNTHFKAVYERQRNDNLQVAGRAALGLAEAAHQLTLAGSLPKDLALEVPYPTTEGPIEVKELQQVKQGGWVEPDQQDAAAIDSMNKGIDDALADILSGDRSKARTALTSGSAKLDSVDFGIFLATELLDGATMFDRKHGRDSSRLKTLCGEADETTKAALALLKDAPNPDKEKEIKKLQDRTKTILKNL